MIPLWKRSRGVAAFAALTVFLCSGFQSSSPTGCQPSSQSRIGPSGGEIAGAIVGAGAVVAVVVLLEVNHSNHILKGCVVSNATGLELRTSDSRQFQLDGDMSKIHVGDKVKIHGSKIKKEKNATGDQVFKVEKLDKSYGTCDASPQLRGGF
jgi:hypothetical protein